ncbi:F0F1 ATP synthase subunit A [Ruminococcus sp.]|uniref:F0F1 ATP synthase subunit A n=1 Tax=Ruminococcus sp. TaxID=41978 RepID=UPI0025CD277F|nr:F0F1 ATP synthase subunit A [Ruminococcus sp.]
MTSKSRSFRVVDILLLLFTVLPLLGGMILKILTSPASEGIEISGAKIFFTIPMPLQDLPITESQINSWLVILSVLFLCLYLTHGITAEGGSRRQHIAEWIVEKTHSLVKGNMGDYFEGFAPFIAAIMALSAFSSLLTLIGLYPPTSDLNVVAGWAILTFVLITFYKLKCGSLHYIKSFAEPVALFAPMNLISEVATPISMAFRHYGNVLSGSVISVLVAAALQGLSHIVLGWLPGVLGEIPFLQIGIPAVLSIYFDVFSGLLQAFIFAMLTMLYVSNGFPAADYAKKKAKKQKQQITVNE